MANFYGRLQIDPSNATAPGPVSLANGVIFAGSTLRKGPIYAVEAKTGKVLWSYQTGATLYGGVSVGNGCIYLGNGYTMHAGSGNGSGVLINLAINGEGSSSSLYKRISLKSWLLGYEGRNHSKLDASLLGKRSQLC
ncbi:hypothetical protein Peur_063989 [Populus x canadensis]